MTSQFGISTDQAESAAGGLLGLIKGQAPGVFEDIAANVAGARELNERTDNFVLGADTDDGGGLLESLADAASSLLGGESGSAGGVLGALEGLQKSGLQLGQIDEFLEIVGKFFKDKGGSDLLKEIAEQIPALKGMLG